jgi:redox-sensitive bicupin YhaK (pirin superfamily)
MVKIRRKIQNNCNKGEYYLCNRRFRFLSLGNKIILSSESDDALVALIGGEKITSNIYFSGPFVAASIEGISKAEKNFIAGKMGTLDGVPF